MIWEWSAQRLRKLLRGSTLVVVRAASRDHGWAAGETKIFFLIKMQNDVSTRMTHVGLRPCGDAGEALWLVPAGNNEATAEL